MISNRMATNLVPVSVERTTVPPVRCFGGRVGLVSLRGFAHDFFAVFEDPGGEGVARLGAVVGALFLVSDRTDLAPGANSSAKDEAG